MKKAIVKSIGAIICSFLVFVNYSDSMQSLRKLNDTVYYDSTENISHVIDNIDSGIFATDNTDIPVTSSTDETLSEGTSVTVSLFGVLPVRTVTFKQKEDITLIPSGHCVGINLNLSGVLVVGTGDVTVDNSGTTLKSPAYVAGIRAGDYIIAANGTQVTDTEMLVDICKESGKNVTLTVSRNGSASDIKVESVLDRRTNEYKIGVWVREDTAGIGTLSFYDPETSRFAALGHPVTDIDTGSIFSIDDGNICDCTIMGVTKGASGSPGELSGMFSVYDHEYGSITHNTEFGIFGSITDEDELNFRYENGIPLAYPDEVSTGSASILCSVDNSEPKEYTCKIVKLSKQSSPAIKGMVVEVTDDELISKTGGIIQGMSGSPILQNGKLVGVVTHVMINNPRRGYGMYAYWMYCNSCVPAA